MRTLAKELVENGAGAQDRVDMGEDLVEPAEAAAPRQPTPSQVREVKRDRALSHIAILLLDTAKTVKPVFDLFSDWAMVWAAFLALVGLSAYEIQHPSWERLATVGAFTVAAAILIRWGRR